MPKGQGGVKIDTRFVEDGCVQYSRVFATTTSKP